MSLESLNNQHYQHFVNPASKVCWSAIVGGALIAFGLTLIFNLLFVSVGLSLNNSVMADKENLSFIASLFYILGGFLLLFIAGIITGKIYKGSTNRLNGKLQQEKYRDKSACFSAMHGFIAWVLYLIINLTFLSLLSQATPIESPFMYVNNQASEQLNQQTSTSNLSSNCEVVKPSSEITNKDINETVQNGAMIIFIIFTSGALAFVIGSWRGCRYGLNKTQPPAL